MAVVFACILLPRAPFALDKLYGVDETLFALTANAIVDGGLPYKDATEIKPPLIHYLMAAVFKLFGKWDMAPLRWTMALLICLTAAGVFKLGEHLRGRKAGLFAALIFALASFNSYWYDTFPFQTEWLMSLFCVWGALAYLKGLGGRSPAPMWIAGTLLALAALSKQLALLHYAGCWMFLAAVTAFGDRTVRGRQLLALSVSFLAVLSSVAAYFAARGAFGDMVYYTWEYNKFYAEAIPLRDKVWHTFNNLFPAGGFLAENHLMTYPAILSFMLTGPRLRASERAEGAQAAVLIGFWAAASFAGIFITGTGYSYYLVQLLPPLCLASGLLFDTLVEWLEKVRPLSDQGRAGWFGAFFVLMILYYPSLYALTSPSKVTYRLDMLPWFAVPERIMSYSDISERVDFAQTAKHFKYNTTPDQKVLVWGFVPHIYMRSQRTPATRYIVCNYLNGIVLPSRTLAKAVAPGAWDIFMKELERSRPAYIADSSVTNHFAYKDVKPTNFAPLKKLMEEQYVFDRVVDMVNTPSFHIYRRKDLPSGFLPDPLGSKGYWPMDWNSHDLSGSGKHGVSVGAIYQEGKAGACAFFDGLNDQFQLPAGFEGMDEGFTVLFWCKPEKAAHFARFFDWGSGPAIDNVLFTRVGFTRDLMLEIYHEGGGPVGRVVASGALEDGKWQHFAVSVDRSGDAAIFKDGVRIASGKVTLPRRVARSFNWIGRSNWPADHGYAGHLDEFRYFERALSDAEIASIARK